MPELQAGLVVVLRRLAMTITKNSFAFRRVKRAYPNTEQVELHEAIFATGGWKAVNPNADLEALAARGARSVNLAVRSAFDVRFPDFQIGELLRAPKLPEGLTLAYPSFGALKLAVTEEQGKAATLARTCEFKFIRPRHRYMLACNNHGRLSGHGFDEEVPWTGTLKELADYAVDAQARGATEITIGGGYDGSEYFDFDPYDPIDCAFWSLTALIIAQHGKDE
jgi:hypothetical protein